MIVVYLMLILMLSAPAHAATVALQWDPSPEPELAGYRVYYSATNTQPFVGSGATEGDSPQDADNATTFVLHGLSTSTPWYFAVTAYNTSGVESAYSNIVTILPQDWMDGTRTILIRAKSGGRITGKGGGMVSGKPS